MTLEVFRSAGSEVCAVALRDKLLNEEIFWEFLPKTPSQMLLAFLNEDYGSLLAQESPLRELQQAYLRERLSGGSCRHLRDMIDHVLVCKREKGFDPVMRLAAYTYAEGLFDVDRLTRYTEKATLEASVLGAQAMERMSAAWAALLEQRRNAALPASKEVLFDALLMDATAQGYPFELSFCQEYSSFAHLLKAFAVELIRGRSLLKRCQCCGRYFPARESLNDYCAGQSPDHPQLSCREVAETQAPQTDGRADGIAKLYKQIYNAKANRFKRSGAARDEKELEDFKAQARQWRLRIRNASASQEDYFGWLQQCRAMDGKTAQ
ncbi:MAG: DUF6076 domain-containing protein [Oscillospiraceae bacterium]|nr:DUF6076 domain-containing protein [Oscillospiraceae bacterium]